MVQLVEHSQFLFECLLCLHNNSDLPNGLPFSVSNDAVIC